jgi:hypothetical protein
LAGVEPDVGEPELPPEGTSRENPPLSVWKLKAAEGSEEPGRLELNAQMKLTFGSEGAWSTRHINRGPPSMKGTTYRYGEGEDRV